MKEVQPSNPQAVNDKVKTPSCEKKLQLSSAVEKPEPCSPVFSLEAESEAAPPSGVEEEVDGSELVKKLEPQLQTVDPVLVSIESQAALKEAGKEPTGAKDQTQTQTQTQTETQLPITKSQKKAEVRSRARCLV